MGTTCSSKQTTGHSLPTNLSLKELDELYDLTNIPRHDIVMYHHQFIKASPNGRMTQLQFDNQLHAMGASTDGSKAIFKMIDKDNSGQISFGEYLLSIAMFSQQSQPEQQLAAVFDTYQALGRQSLRGTLTEAQVQGMTRDNVQNMLERMHPELTPDEIEDLCDRYMAGDQNKNGYISKQEFIAACMKNPKLMEQLGHKDAAITTGESRGHEE